MDTNASNTIDQTNVVVDRPTPNSASTPAIANPDQHSKQRYHQHGTRTNAGASSSATFPRPTAHALKRSPVGGRGSSGNVTSATRIFPNMNAGSGSNSSSSTLSRKYGRSVEHSTIGAAGTPIAATIAATTANNALLKLSVSMISLQPSNAAQTPEAGMPSMRQERPYNSLKKKRNSDRELWRQSWGSAHSQSSCSIHSSNAAASNTGLSQSGKDDFWAALQTNYNYIMDTHLLDTCKEARGELLDGGGGSDSVAAATDVIDGAAKLALNNADNNDDDDSCDDCAKLNNASGRSPIALINDPRRLRRWLRKMEMDMAAAPTLFQAKRMKTGELRRRLHEHSDLYRQIVSQTSEVRACIRTAEENAAKPQPQRNSGGATVVVAAAAASSTSTQQQQPSTAAAAGHAADTVSPPRKSDTSSLKGLETRYHMLYLQAIEVQCLLEGLLARKEKEEEEEDSSSASSIPSDTDEEPAAKFPRLNERAFAKQSVDAVDSANITWLPFNLLNVSPTNIPSNNGFEADSEGSDNESAVNSQTPIANRSEHATPTKPPTTLNAGIVSMIGQPSVNRIADVAAAGVAAATGSMGIAAEATVAIGADVPDCNGNPICYHQSAPKISVSNTVAVVVQPLSKQCGTVTPAVQQPKQQQPQHSGTKRSRMPDVSKFNRSNRKSKNCATFYFKHSDTDGEARDWSTPASESMNATSEEDEWVYKNKQAPTDGQVPTNSNNTTNNNNDDEPSSTSDDDNDNMKADDMTNANSSPADGRTHLTSLSTIDGVVLRFDGQQDAHGCPTVANGNHGNASEMANIMTSSTTSTVIELVPARQRGVDQPATSSAPKHYNKESIQQLVMDAETLVREDHLIQELARKYSFSADKRSATLNGGKLSTHVSESSIQNAFPKIKRVHDWLMHQQPLVGSGGVNGAAGLQDVNIASTDCEASAENTESDSSGARDSDTSDIMSDSVATCLQETDHRSSQFFTSTERIDGPAAGSVEILQPNGNGSTAATVDSGSAVALPSSVTSPNMGPPKVVMRTKRRNSERPWSVSCLSQLRQTETTAQARALEQAATNQGLANHSISESALHMWSTATVLPPSATVSATTVATTATTATSVTTVHQSQSSMRSVESKNSLKRRKMRARKKLLGRKSESGSNGSDHNGTGNGVQELSRILTSTLSKSETFAGRTDLVEDLSAALSMLAIPRVANGEAAGSSGAEVETPLSPQQHQQMQHRASSDQESEEEATKHMMKPNFRLGAYTSSYGAGASKLGSLAALANYNSEIEVVKELSFTGTDNSNEQAWDPYQDRYNSEAYSEGMDSDAARRLLEFGDDYRNFLDSQSDCCSSLSAANNNLDSSLSPLTTRRAMHPMMMAAAAASAAAAAASQQHRWSSSKSPSKSPTRGHGGGDESTVMRQRRRVPEFEFDRRRKSSEGSRKLQLNEFCKSMGIDRLSSSSGKSSPQQHQHHHNQHQHSAVANAAVTAVRPSRFSNGSAGRSHNGHHHSHHHNGSTSAINRKLEMEFISKLEKRQSHDDLLRRRLHSQRTLQNGGGGGSSSSADDSSSFVEHANDDDDDDDDAEDESEMIQMLLQCEQRMEHTRALRVRSHLLRPEDYAEIITTCRDNIKCLETLLRGPPGTVLSAARSQEIRDILSSWESLLHWSENASVARQLQEEMATLKGVLNKLGRSGGAASDDGIGSGGGVLQCDSETSIQLCIEELRNEKTALQTHRSAMLRLNASVHSWLTRQEMKLAKARAATAAAAATVAATTDAQQQQADRQQPPASAPNSAANDSATQMDEVHNDEEELHAQLKNEVGDMYSVWDEADARIGSRLDGLTASLIAWKQFESGLNEFKEALGKDKGALRGLNGILDGLGGNDGQLTATGNSQTLASTSTANDASAPLSAVAATTATVAAADGAAEVENTKLALDVKAVAKRLSEQLDINQQQQQQQQQQRKTLVVQPNAASVQQIAGPDNQYLNSLLTAIPFGLSSSSNGSLSDSGISDGGASSSDYGLSERERRLSALRRLARQLESALAPGSAALNSIAQRMEAAEADLRSLQDTCRQLIVRTAASQMQQQQQQQKEKKEQDERKELQQLETASSDPIAVVEIDLIDGSERTGKDVAPVAKKANKSKRSTPQSSQSSAGKRPTNNQRRKNSTPSSPGRTATNGGGGSVTTISSTSELLRSRHQQQQQLNGNGGGVGAVSSSPSASDPSGDPSDDGCTSERRRWARRVAKYALPIQVALVAIICAVACLEPHCCDTLNNHFMSFTPQLRYVRGPPPI